MLNGKKARLFVLASVLTLVVLLAATGCSKPPVQPSQPQNNPPAGGSTPSELSGNLTISGSTALQPLVDEAAKQFMAKHPKVRITVQGGGSGTGLSQVSTGAVQIGMSDIFAEEKEGIDASQLTDHRVCVVGFATVINPGVTANSVTQQQLIDIFTKKVKNWSEVGGAKQDIVLINRAKGSGTRATFKKYALKGTEEAEGMSEDSSGAVRKIVSETPGAISYLALSYVDKSVKTLKIDNIEPTEENITSGKYPVWSYEHLYTKGQPQGLAKEFLDYMVSDDVQKTLVGRMGYIPITNMKTTRNP